MLHLNKKKLAIGLFTIISSISLLNINNSYADIVEPHPCGDDICYGSHDNDSGHTINPGDSSSGSSGASNSGNYTPPPTNTCLWVSGNSCALDPSHLPTGCFSSSDANGGSITCIDDQDGNINPRYHGEHGWQDGTPPPGSPPHLTAEEAQEDIIHQFTPFPPSMDYVPNGKGQNDNRLSPLVKLPMWFWISDHSLGTRGDFNSGSHNDVVPGDKTKTGESIHFHPYISDISFDWDNEKGRNVSVSSSCPEYQDSNGIQSSPCGTTYLTAGNKTVHVTFRWGFDWYINNETNNIQHYNNARVFVPKNIPITVYQEESVNREVSTP